MNVQIEHGYTKIANQIIEALAKHHPGFTEGQVLWAVLRKTYGWNKKADKISISQLVKATGKSRRMVIYAIQNLEAKKMISVERDFRQANSISFNKNYDQWLHNGQSENYKKLHLVQNVAPSATNHQKVVQHSVKNIQKVAPTKETITKETIQKKAELVSVETFFFSFKEIDSELVAAKATEFDVRPKDIVYCAQMAEAWNKGKQILELPEVEWLSKLDMWIARSIRRHELKTNADRVEDEKKPVISAEDRWIAKTITFVEGT